MKSKKAGELIQVDHISVGIPAAFSLKNLKQLTPLLHYQHTYNLYRLHDYLDLKIPIEYYHQITEAA
jgi:transposase InsO family protein